MVTRSILRQLLGTVVAVLAGWLVALMFAESLTFIGVVLQRHPLDVKLDCPQCPPRFTEPFLIMVSFILIYLYYIIPVWLIVLIPLYLFIPSSSPLWHWPICVLCGAAAGYLINAGFVLLLAVYVGVPWPPGAWWDCCIGAVFGAAICLVGSLTRRVFKPNHLTPMKGDLAAGIPIGKKD